MSINDLDVGRSRVNVPTTEQTEVAAQTARTKRSGKTGSGTSANNLTVKRQSASPQYSTGAPAGGPELPAPIPVNATDLMAILFSLRQKHTESSIESAEQRIHDRSVDREIKSKEMVTKLQKIIAQKKKSRVGGIFAKIFAWVGVALSFIVAGVIGVVSGGAAAAPLLMLAAASAVILIAQQSGLMEKAMDAMHMDDKAKMGLSLGITALMLVVNIVAVVASGGASAVGVAAEVAESATEVAATTGEAAAEVGATAAEAATEASASVAEAAVETSTKVAETAVEASTKATETAVEASTKAAESAVEASTKTAESAATTSADVAEGVVKEPTAVVRAVAGKLGMSSSRVLRVVDKVRSGVKVAEGVTQLSVGGLSIGNAAKSYEATKARASAMRDKAVLAKMQAQDEDDMRRIRNMIEQLENAQTAVMSTVSKSHEVALQIRQNI